MNENIEKLLLGATNSIGSNIEKIWEIFIKQAYIDGVFYAVLVLVSFGIAVFVTKWITNQEFNKQDASAESFSSHTCSRIFLTLFLIVTSLITWYFFMEAVNNLLNPDFIVIKKIIITLKK